MKWALALVLVLLLPGCGGATSAEPTTTAPATPPGPGSTLYAGGDWAVKVDGGKATAFHRVGGEWRADRSRAVRIRILGPEGKVDPIPQVAVELSAKTPLIESGMWVDGEELLAKGGGLAPTKGTIYGAPGAALTPGEHLAVAYARTATHATAVAWTFRV